MRGAWHTVVVVVVVIRTDKDIIIYVDWCNMVLCGSLVWVAWYWYLTVCLYIVVVYGYKNLFSLSCEVEDYRHCICRVEPLECWKFWISLYNYYMHTMGDSRILSGGISVRTTRNLILKQKQLPGTSNNHKAIGRHKLTTISCDSQSLYS